MYVKRFNFSVKFTCQFVKGKHISGLFKKYAEIFFFVKIEQQAQTFTYFDTLQHNCPTSNSHQLKIPWRRTCSIVSATALRTAVSFVLLADYAGNRSAENEL